MIYWDNNATTPVAEEVLEAMLPYLQGSFFNPSAAYGPAKRVRLAMDEARERVAALLGVHPGEIIFTSGGTESTNTALAQFRRTLCPATEHPATLRTVGADPCPVQRDGTVDADEWAARLPGHDGASFALANHETGVLQDAARLAEEAQRAGARVHLDIVQAAGKIPLNLRELPVEFASVSAHKLHGPKGIGALYVRCGTDYQPTVTGGSQEDRRRAGTENVPGIIGFGKAAELALQAADRYAELAGLRDAFVEALRQNPALPRPVINGEGAPRLPHVSNLRFPGIPAQSLTLLLEPAGLLCSAGSACTSAEPRPSHVLRAMGLSDTEARESLRFSLNRFCTRNEVEEAVRLVTDAVQRVQAAQSSSTGPVLVYRP